MLPEGHGGPATSAVVRGVRIVAVCAATLAMSLGGGLRLHAAGQNGTIGTDVLRQQANERLLALHEEADRLVGEARGLLGQLRTLEVARQIANEERHQAEAAAAGAAEALEAVTREVVQLERARDAEGPRLASRLSDLYKLGRGRYVRMLLSATDVRQVGQAARTVAAVAALDRARVRRYNERLTELSAARSSARDRQAAFDARRAEAVRAQAATARAIAAQNALVHEIDQQRDLNARLVSEMQAAQRKLEAAVAGIEGASMTALPIGPFRGALPWPAVGTPRRRTTAAGNRPGLEIQSTEGTPVRSVHDGTVAFAGSFEGLGNLIIIDHGEQAFSLYGHLLELSIGRGTVVRAGQSVGRLGGSDRGDATLYFELRVGGKPVDPLPWLAPAR